jgi:hypothetical protein
VNALAAWLLPSTPSVCQGSGLNIPDNDDLGLYIQTAHRLQIVDIFLKTVSPPKPQIAVVVRKKRRASCRREAPSLFAEIP